MSVIELLAASRAAKALTAANSLTVKDAWASARGIGGALCQPPAGFPWDFAKYPLNVYRDRKGVYSTDLNPRAFLPAAIFTGPVYWVDVVNGNNANNGLSRTTAFQSEWKAKEVMNAGGVPCSCNIIGGPNGVPVPHDFMDVTNASGLGTGRVLTVDAAFFAVGNNPVTMGPIWHPTNFAADTANSRPNTYRTTSLGTGIAGGFVLRVLDKLTLDKDGCFTDIPKLVDAAAVEATATGGWALGGTFYMRRPDGKVPDASNTLIVTSGSFRTGTKSLYMQGITIVGKFDDDTNSAPNTALILEDCDFTYAGGDTVTNDSVAIDKRGGSFVGLWRCRAFGSTKDNFNFHASDNLRYYVLTVDCEGFRSGDKVNTNSTSNNGNTGHENVVGIDLNGKYYRSSGGTVHWINSSELWALGTRADRDDGNLDRGGTVPSVSYRVTGTAKMYLQECRGGRASLMLQALDAGSYIGTRGMSVGQFGGAGVIAAM